MAIARHPEAYRDLSIQFENRKVSKVYHAIVDGIHVFENEEVKAPILKQSDGTVKMDRKGKSALTTFNTLWPYKFHTLVQCEPLTGRMHQIRLHLTSLGAPITGDITYGGKPFYLSSVKRGFNLKKNSDEEPLIKRMALHAHKLAFSGLKGDKIEAIAPYPKDFSALMKQLSSNVR